MDTNSWISGVDFGSLATVGLDCSTRKAWDAMMLSESATNRPFNSPAPSPPYRMFLFSFANNFAGALLKEPIFGYLQSKTSEDLYRIIRAAPEYYTTRAIARNLFHFSIEVGNAQIVDFLLKESFPDVKANSIIPSHNGLYHTPIEKAAAMMHTGVVKVLLAHCADVKQFNVYGQTRGALNCLVRGLPHSRPNVVDQLDPELFSALVNAGGKMDDETLYYLIENDRKGRFVPLIFSKQISQSHRRWSDAGIFLKVFRYSQIQTSLEVLRLMLTNNVDINYQVDLKCQVDFCGGDMCRKTLIDVVSFNGDLELVETLLEYGATLTADTLPCAIESGNEDLVKVLFRLGAKTDNKGWSKQSALATALTSQNPNMIELVVGQQGLKSQDNPENLQKVIKASVQNPKIMDLIIGQRGLESLDNPENLQEVIRASVHNPKIMDLVVGRQGLGFLENPESLQEVIRASVQNPKLMDLVVGQQGLKFLKTPKHLHEVIIALFQNPIIVDLVVGQQRWGPLEDPEYLQIATKLASVIGDISWIGYLVKKGGVLDPGDLGLGLAKAVIDGKIDFALALLDAGAEIDFHGVKSWGYFRGPPLAQALQHGNARLVFALLEAGADPNYDLGSDIKPSLELAVKCGDPAVVRAVIEAGANLDRNGLALTTAIKCRNKDLAITLLHAGCRFDDSRLAKSDETALGAAVGADDLDFVRLVIEWGADPHDPDALHLAWKHNPAAFDLILGEHASRYPKGRKEWGAAILKEALDLNDFQSFQQILKRGADPNYYPGIFECYMEFDADGKTTLFGYAISKSNNTRIKFVEFLLLQQQMSGCTPETIVFDTIPDVVRVRYTAFLAAIESGGLPTIELLLRHGANVNYPVRNSIRRTPLQKAAEIGNTDVVDLLLKRGADPNGRAAHKAGGTALQLASIGGYLRIVQLLLNEGADVNAPPSKIEGRTPLEGAAEHGRLDMVAFLLKAGAGQNSNDKKEFDRAIGRAKENGFPYIADLLKQYLATGKVSASRPLFDEFVNYDMLE